MRAKSAKEGGKKNPWFMQRELHEARGRISSTRRRKRLGLGKK